MLFELGKRSADHAYDYDDDDHHLNPHNHDDHDNNDNCLGISRGERTAYHAEGRRTVFGED